MQKTILFSAILLTGINAVAQPVILNGANIPAAGYSAAIYNGPASVAPGSGGAGVTWDFSTLALANVGTYAVLDPAATPVAATYPSGNFAVSVTPSGGSALYSYFIIGASSESELANSVTTTAGSGRNYTPGPRKVLKFPFNYADTFTSNYATSTTTGHDFFEYDGYGTLITPWATYHNAVRVKDTYTTAIGYSYNWYILSPLLNVLSYDSNSNTFTGINAVETGVSQAIPAICPTMVAPNPFTNCTTLTISNAPGSINAIVIITDMAGRVVRQVTTTGIETVINRDGLCAGSYMYTVVNNGSPVASGKLVVN